MAYRQSQTPSITEYALGLGLIAAAIEASHYLPEASSKYTEKEKTAPIAAKISSPTTPTTQSTPAQTTKSSSAGTTCSVRIGREGKVDVLPEHYTDTDEFMEQYRLSVARLYQR